MQHNTAAVSNNNDFVVVLGDTTSMKKIQVLRHENVPLNTILFRAH